MLDAWASAASSVLALPTLGVILVGILIGFVVGLLPGLGGPVTLAIMIPFTFGMEPITAFALLLSMLAVTPTVGGLTSILLGVPGEAVSAALVLDGRPMARRGEAGRAISASLVSSLVGALIGVAVLTVSIPIIRPVVLAFGSPEFFMLIVVGITFLGALSAGSPSKGLLAGVIGLMFGTVGMSLQSSIPRFTFGMLELWDGVGLVAAAMGLFAFPEIVDMLRQGSSLNAPLQDVGRGMWSGVRDVIRHRWLTLRCSLLGTFIGIVPGLGGTVAQWIAYAHAAQGRPSEQAFGDGAIEGVIGPGAANDAKDGGSLIPTIAFGVPGSLNMAILLGAFLIHGLVPGQAMLTTNLDVTLSMILVLIISNVVAVAIALLTAKHLVRVMLIPVKYLVPPTIALLYMGAYVSRNSMFALGMLILFGFIGLAMKALDWPRAPLILGLILGPLGENYLFISVSRYGLGWFQRPIVIFLAIVSVLAILRSLRSEKPEHAGLRGGEPDATPVPGSDGTAHDPGSDDRDGMPTRRPRDEADDL